jgi:hypothetical protein
MNAPTPFTDVPSGSKDQSPNYEANNLYTRLNDPEFCAATRANDANISSQKTGSSEQVVSGQCVRVTDTCEIPKDPQR